MCIRDSACALVQYARAEESIQVESVGDRPPRRMPRQALAPVSYTHLDVYKRQQYLCPGLDGAEEAAIGQLAVDAFLAAGCSGWGRVDVMRERSSGKLLLLEVNTAPGMTSHSLVPKSARAVGIEFDELCWRILEQTMGEGASK